ncbi:L-xylo-3-hexulose reductase [Ascosphaera aggregata]|nr:L-xylo-3-hexulose reductase [Ascosphaera aggregata]
MPITATTQPYKGKLGIITGGSRGIGAAVARRLASKGCQLILVYTSSSSQKLAEELCVELSSVYDAPCTSVRADLSRPEESVPMIIEAAKLHYMTHPPQGRDKFQIDILVNNAGIASDQRLNDPEQGPIGSEVFDRLYTVNVLAPLLLTQAVELYLPHDRSGRIVNTSSVSSSIGYPGQSIYAGTKAALEAMTRTWSRELATRATVNAVNPGPAWGDMYTEAGEKFWRINQPYVDATPLAEYHGEKDVLEMAGGDAERFDKIVRKGMGSRRPGFSMEIAGTIDMLCSAEASWTTGSVICANGGMKMSIA